MTVPVIVVTGFLGSGKTTLLNRVLARRAAREAGGIATGRIGVIVNELGEVGVDGELLAGGARQVELPGGCVCCVLNDALDRTVLDLIAATPGLDAIVLETTGVAEPLPIAWAFGRAPLADAARLAVIVSLVDATAFLASRPVSPAVDEQIRHADVLVVTKRELVAADALAAALREVRLLAPDAPIVDGSLDEAAAWLEGVIADPFGPDGSGRAGDGARDHAHAHAHVHADNDAGPGHAHGVDSVWCPVPDVLDLEELEDQLADLPGHFIRIKGVARAVDPRIGESAPRWYAFHRVGLRVSSEPIAPATTARAVALGHGVERGPLAACIEAAMISSGERGANG